MILVEILVLFIVDVVLKKGKKKFLKFIIKAFKMLLLDFTTQ